MVNVAFTQDLVSGPEAWGYIMFSTVKTLKFSFQEVLFSAFSLVILPAGCLSGGPLAAPTILIPHEQNLPSVLGEDSFLFLSPGL